jgi:hypothetical protein
MTLMPIFWYEARTLDEMRLCTQATSATGTATDATSAAAAAAAAANMASAAVVCAVSDREGMQKESLTANGLAWM